MIDKNEIAKTLVATRDARLLLEMACWVHDLDKAAWPFALSGPLDISNIRKNDKAKPLLENISCGSLSEQQMVATSELKEKHQALRFDPLNKRIADILLFYEHKAQPHRSLNEGLWNWENHWLEPPLPSTSSLASCSMQFKNLLRIDGPDIDFLYFDREEHRPYCFIVRPNETGSFPSLFLQHSYSSVAEAGSGPWEPWIISAPFGGGDGIDSQYFKGGESGRDGKAQKTIPPMVATPFGLETPVLGDASNLNDFITKNQEKYREIWKTAFDWAVPGGKTAIGCRWQFLRNYLRLSLKLSLGYTNRPTNDVNLWDHSYGVGSMGKAVAAALALDSFAAKEGGKKLLFPLRSPERNLRPLFQKEAISPAAYLLAGGLGADDHQGLELQVQTKFKVLSVLIRDQGRLYIGRRVGDILAYHRLRNLFFNRLAKIFEQELAVASEIFRDHAGIHFLIPWCQDSLDAHLQLGASKAGSPRTQETLEDMMEDVIKGIVKLAEWPNWALSVGIKNPMDGDLCDFDLIAHIGPNREPLLGELQEGPGKEAGQGLLFLKNNTRITKDLDLEYPRPFTRLNTTAESGKQLCPVCRKYPGGSAPRGANENDAPCTVCENRRVRRTSEWWKGICQNPQIAHTTIWAAEAADGANRVNLLTIAFDLRRWFNSEAFEGFWMRGAGKLKHLPVYPAPARIRGVWEASLDFLKKLGERVKQELSTRERVAFKVLGPLNQFNVLEGQGVLLTPVQRRQGFGDWFLGEDQGNLFLLSTSGTGVGQSVESLSDLSRQLIKDLTYRGEQRPLLTANLQIYSEKGSLNSYVPYVAILDDSPTRFQALVPGEKTEKVLGIVQRLFIDHFGKVAHNMETCVSCLTFKETFAFYLALEAADRIVAQELERARPAHRHAQIDLLGLLVDLDAPDRVFLGPSYQWQCLTPESRDPYRSMVADALENETGKIYHGWIDKEGKPELQSLRRRLPFPKMKESDGIWDVDSEEQVFLHEELSGPHDFTARVCCPRVAWAHLASPGERHQEQLSIPLLALSNWIASYKLLLEGVRDLNCESCLGEIHLSAEDMRQRKERIKKMQFAGLSGNATRLRNVVEELLEGHVRWPATSQCENERGRVLRDHNRAVLSNPGGCGPAWRRWAVLDEQTRCLFTAELDSFYKMDPLAGEDKKELGKAKKKIKEQSRICAESIPRLIEALNRLEEMAVAFGGRGLLVTYDLLSRVCNMK